MWWIYWYLQDLSGFPGGSEGKASASNVLKATLTRFFAFHFILPFIITALAIVHLLFLHKTGSNNPTGIPSDTDKIPFHPYYTIKDILGAILLILTLMLLVLFTPDLLGDPDNYTPANPLNTPPHIKPEWYFLFATIATAFIGYVLPWGQMSFWGATVITNLLSAIPYIGTNLVEWIWGGFSVEQGHPHPILHLPLHPPIYHCSPRHSPPALPPRNRIEQPHRNSIRHR